MRNIDDFSDLAEALIDRVERNGRIQVTVWHRTRRDDAIVQYLDGHWAHTCYDREPSVISEAEAQEMLRDSDFEVTFQLE